MTNVFRRSINWYGSDDGAHFYVSVLGGGLIGGGGLILATQLGPDEVSYRIDFDKPGAAYNEFIKDVVHCDFGKGISFFISTTNSNVPEAVRPLLSTGLASGACRPVLKQG